MQKNLTALAITTVLALSAPAYAGVTVYGQANVSYDLVSTGNTQTGVAGITSRRVSSNSSRLGVKGSNELDSGWSAQWQAEATLGMDTGAAGSAPTSTSTSTTTASAPPVVYTTTTTTTTSAAQVFDRNTYLGLSHADKGTLLLGRYDTPYKMATRRLDVFADGIADNRSLMGTTVAGGVVNATFDTRLSNIIAYLSPDTGALRGSLAYANLAESNTNSVQARQSAFSLAGMYEQGALYVAFAYQVHNIDFKDQAKPATALKAFKLGLGYTMGSTNLGFAYERSSDDLGNTVAADAANPCGGKAEGENCSGHSTVYLSAKLNFTAKDAFKMAYAKAGQVGKASNSTGALQFSMGFDHGFNEFTTAYVLYTALKNDSLAGYSLSNVATGGANSVSGLGGSASALSFGVRHSF